MITFFCDFCQFSAKKWRFSQKPMLWFFAKTNSTYIIMFRQKTPFLFFISYEHLSQILKHCLQEK
jgi:hypothetical protein